LPLLHAVCEIIHRLKSYWPVSDRQIHYQLLNKPPLIHAGKKGSTYHNDLRSYRALTDILTRGRHEGEIPHEVIADVTRPHSSWKVYRDTGTFEKHELELMFRYYRRDLLQSQPNHIEIVLEKLTVQRILEPIAWKFCVPLTVSRGFCSTRPRFELAQRFRKSGKGKLVLLIVADFDPDGDEIAHSLASSMRNDFGIEEIHPVKVALTHEHITALGLPASMIKAKKGSSNYDRFVQRYSSDNVYELEAVEPETLRRLLTEAIDDVLDKEAFNAELEQEKEDAAHLAGVREQVLELLRRRGIAA
jgi:hypothetical protein